MAPVNLKQGSHPSSTSSSPSLLHSATRTITLLWMVLTILTLLIHPATSDTSFSTQQQSTNKEIWMVFTVLTLLVHPVSCDMCYSADSGYKECWNGCCGPYPEQYCCSTTMLILGLALGGVLVLFITVAVVFCWICKGFREKMCYRPRVRIEDDRRRRRHRRHNSRRVVVVQPVDPPDYDTVADTRAPSVQPGNRRTYPMTPPPPYIETIPPPPSAMGQAPKSTDSNTPSSSRSEAEPQGQGRSATQGQPQGQSSTSQGRLAPPPPPSSSRAGVHASSRNVAVHVHQTGDGSSAPRNPSNAVDGRGAGANQPNRLQGVVISVAEQAHSSNRTASEVAQRNSYNSSQSARNDSSQLGQVPQASSRSSLARPRPRPTAAGSSALSQPRPSTIAEEGTSVSNARPSPISEEGTSLSQTGQSSNTGQQSNTRTNYANDDLDLI